MGCGCKSPQRRGNGGKVEQATDQQVRAVMCAFCPVIHGGPWGGKRVCEDNETVRVKVTIGGRGCPRGHHPDQRGVLNWLGIDWYGAPAPVRWAARAFHQSHRPPSFWPGCGCVKPIKDLWRRMIDGVSRKGQDGVRQSHPA